MVRRKLGELLHFDYQKKVQLIYNQLGAGEVAKVRGLDTDLTFDGARLSNKENHLCGGFKVTDLLCDAGTQSQESFCSDVPRNKKKE